MKKEIRIKREVEVKVNGGYVSEYAHSTYWVKNFKKGGESLVIEDDCNGMNDLVYCTIVCVVDGSDPGYEEEIAKKGKELIYSYSAEFVTNDNIYYVFLTENITKPLKKAFKLQVEDKVSFNGYHEIC